MEEKNTFENIDVEPDSENYRGSSEGPKIRDVVMRQYQKCLEEGSKELNRGGLKKSFVNGKFVEHEIPNQREIVINTFAMLETVLMPTLTKEEKGKLVHEKMMNEMIKIDEEIIAYEKECERIQAEMHQHDTAQSKMKINSKVYAPEEYEKRHNEYELRKVNFYRRKLLILSKLLDKVNYFEERNA